MSYLGLSNKVCKEFQHTNAAEIAVDGTSTSTAIDLGDDQGRVADRVRIQVRSTDASATGGFYAEYSHDGSTYYKAAGAVTLAADVPQTLEFVPVARYIRFHLINNGSTTVAASGYRIDGAVYRSATTARR